MLFSVPISFFYFNPITEIMSFFLTYLVSMK